MFLIDVIEQEIALLTLTAIMVLALCFWIWRRTQKNRLKGGVVYGLGKAAGKDFINISEGEIRTRL